MDEKRLVDGTTALAEKQPRVIKIEPVSVCHGGGEKCSALHPALISPLPIAGYGLTLFLGEGSVDGGDELTAHIDSIDTFTLESDIDTQFL